MIGSEKFDIQKRSIAEIAPCLLEDTEGWYTTVKTAPPKLREYTQLHIRNL